MRAASSPACLSPLLLCLCVLQRSYGTPSPPSPTFSHNQTKLPNGDKDSHHRPKRGWIWNQFFVLEEHIGPDAQYVGKVRAFVDCFDLCSGVLKPCRRAELLGLVWFVK
ncbi:cadherin-18a precursor [Danio rerio]|uniref:Cadherin 18, type 2 n=1 Tax=Danio rerio TaxID=7955 RepID=Q08C62_DANRE|nr:cadherin-18a precursor [Danio rerio]AAI24377.1 Cadherin 18, type 2 [Danio rerio]AAI64912.1 Cdh18 protein [Danio rerio]|eukprot:NP_001070203.1 cadherin 18, type 2a precursor [Danio rerio]